MMARVRESRKATKREKKQKQKEYENINRLLVTSINNERVDTKSKTSLCVQEMSPAI